MNDEANREPSPIRFVGVTAAELSAEPNVGDVVQLSYAGTTYNVRVVRRYDDYDDFGNAVPRYDLEAT